MCVISHKRTPYTPKHTNNVFKKRTLNGMYNKERSKYVSSKYNDNDYFALLYSKKQKYYLINYVL